MIRSRHRLTSFSFSIMTLLFYGVNFTAPAWANHHEEQAQGDAKKGADAAVHPQHEAQGKHEHHHGKKCGHKAEEHKTKEGVHVDYEHDGHHHRAHDKHNDECAGPESEAVAAEDHGHEQAK